VAQYEIWTGERAPEAAMRRAVLSALAAEEKSHGRSSRSPGTPSLKRLQKTA
jgi:hypothetical protein